MTSALEKNIWSIFNQIIEPGVAENDTRVIYANQNIPQSEIPSLEGDDDFYVTLDLLSGPSRVGHANRVVSGVAPNEILTVTLNSIMTVSVSVYAKATSPKTADIMEKIQKSFYLETVQVLIKSFGMAYSATAGITNASFEEDNIRIALKTIDIVFLSKQEASEGIDIIDTIEVDGLGEGIQVIPPAGGP